MFLHLIYTLACIITRVEGQKMHKALGTVTASLRCQLDSIWN